LSWSHALSTAKPAPIALAVAIIGGVYGLQAVRRKLLARHLGSAPWRTFLRFIIASLAINNVVAGRPGDLMRGYWLARELPTQPTRAYATLIVDRSSDVFALGRQLVTVCICWPQGHWLTNGDTPMDVQRVDRRDSGRMARVHDPIRHPTMDERRTLR